MLMPPVLMFPVRLRKTRVPRGGDVGQRESLLGGVRDRLLVDA